MSLKYISSRVTYTTTQFPNVMKKINNFLMDESFIDVVLVTGRHRIKAHRLILSSWSEYFRAMFTNQMRESSQYEITLKEIDPDALKSIIEFMYAGTLELDDNVVRILLETSRVLCMNEIEEFCVDFLTKKLSLTTCFRIRDFADVLMCASLLTECRKFIACNFTKLVKNERFLLLPAHELANILSYHELNIPSEEAAFEALVLWLDHEHDRMMYAGRLLAHVRVPFLPANYIHENIERNPMFYDDQLSRDIVYEAYEYQVIPELRSVCRTERTTSRPSVVGDMIAVGRVDAVNPTIKVEKFDTSKNEWEQVTTLTNDRLQFGVCEWKNHMCLLGGHNGPNILNSVECFNARTNSKFSLPGLKTARYGMGVGVLQNRIYVCGGHDGRNYINSVELYDEQKEESFNHCAHMISNKFRAGVAVLGDKLYVIGGINDLGRSKTVECYDAFSDRWTQCESLSKARNAVGVGVLNGAIYAVGGVDRSVLESMERFDPRSGEWCTVAPMRMGRARLGVCALGPWLYAAGGYNGGGEFLRHTEVYYPELDKWAELPSLHEICAANILAIRFPSDSHS